MIKNKRETTPLLEACQALQKCKGILAGSDLDIIAASAIKAFLSHPWVEGPMDPELHKELLNLTEVL